jgi:hypothetical protein
MRTKSGSMCVFRTVRNKGETHASSGIFKGLKITGFLRDAGDKVPADFVSILVQGSRWLPP